MSELLGEKKEKLKELIRQLHAGASPEEAKQRFKEVLDGIGPAEIAGIEQELIAEGMSRQEIHRLCDVHLSLFKESLEKEEVSVPEGHPIHILLAEHRLLLGFAEELRGVAEELGQAGGFDSAHDGLKRLGRTVERFKASTSHYVREENVLFPYLEKHGITEPPAVMWMDHDKIREIEKELYELVEGRETLGFQEFTRRLKERALALAEMLSAHFQKENRVLFPTALKVLSAEEWPEVRRQFDDLGYCPFTPERARAPFEGAQPVTSSPGKPGPIEFDTGSFSRHELEAMLNSLPVDITFVDKDNTVRYFSASKERIFPRTKAIIGRKVQQCHPEKSVHVVNEILEGFRSGRRDSAEFWIRVEGRLIYIRYFAVRDAAGEYLGCVEVTQDITDIQGIKGEKRLL